VTAKRTHHPVKKLLQGHVAEALGLCLNERLARCVLSRIEYGYQDDVLVTFEISHALGGFHVVPETKFAAHPGERGIGIFGTGNPVEALRLLLMAYPDATVLMRRDGKRRVTRIRRKQAA